MNKLVTIFMMLFLVSFNSSNLKKNRYENDSYIIDYHTINGIIHDSYKSFYPNGSRKAEGQFEYGTRIGQWSVWDSNGVLIAKRNYSNMFDIGLSSNNTAVGSTVNSNWSAADMNAKGFIDYHAVTEKDVMFSKRYYRTLSLNQNHILVQYNLLKVMDDLVKIGKIEVYNSDNFENKLSSVPSLNSFNIIGFVVMEDYFFDVKRKIGETRILAISPYFIDENNDINTVYSIYFTDLRESLATIKMSDNQLPDKIVSLESVFFHRFFASEIYKVENLQNKAIKDYKNGHDIKEESLKLEFDIIENEHALWLQEIK